MNCLTPMTYIKGLRNQNTLWTERRWTRSSLTMDKLVECCPIQQISIAFSIIKLVIQNIRS